MAKRRGSFLRTAIKRPGRLTRACKQRGYTKATCACANEILRTSKDRSLKAAAALGKRLMGCSGAKPIGPGAKKRRRNKRK